MITLEQTKLDPDIYEKGVEFDIPLEGNWITVVQFFNKKEDKSDKFFHHHHSTDLVTEIGYRKFKRLLGEFMGSTIFDALHHIAETKPDPELESFKLSGITLLE